MKDVVISSPVIAGPAKRLSPVHLWELTTRPFMFKAERWKRRAMFYERHREYFPRVAASRFIDRCRELEATYREFVAMMIRMAMREQPAPARAMMIRKQYGKRAMVPTRLAALTR